MVNGWTIKWRKMQDVNRDRRDENAMEGSFKRIFQNFSNCLHTLKINQGVLEHTQRFLIKILAFAM
jgi:hypothetical protein